jgi:hypothetical protein
VAGRPDLVMCEPERCSQPLVPPVLSVFCQVLNLHRSLLLTCTEEPHAELIHPGAADLRLPVPPVAAAGPRFVISSSVRRAAPGAAGYRPRQDRTQDMCAPTPARRSLRPRDQDCRFGVSCWVASRLARQISAVRRIAIRLGIHARHSSDPLAASAVSRPRPPPPRWFRAAHECAVPREPRRSTRRSRHAPASGNWASASRWRRFR